MRRRVYMQFILKFCCYGLQVVNMAIAYRGVHRLTARNVQPIQTSTIVVKRARDSALPSRDLSHSSLYTRLSEYYRHLVVGSLYHSTTVPHNDCMTLYNNRLYTTESERVNYRQPYRTLYSGIVHNRIAD